jgi:hypothetical protein
VPEHGTLKYQSDSLQDVFLYLNPVAGKEGLSFQTAWGIKDATKYNNLEKNISVLQKWLEYGS